MMKSLFVAALTVSGVLAPVADAAVPSIYTALDPGTVKESMAYLEKTYGVGPQEALRRLELQNDATKLDGLLRAKAPAEYGGMWLNQDKGGVLEVNLTREAVARPYLSSMRDKAHITTHTVQHSVSDLTRFAAQAGPMAGVSEQENRVVTGQQPRIVEATTPDPTATPSVDWGFCHPLYCTGHGSMRGGLRLDITRDNGTVGGCTTGFNLRATGGAFAGTPWVLTAGHCVTNKTNNTPTKHNGSVVLKQHGIERNAYPHDYALVPYVDAATAGVWLDNQTGHDRVLKYCRNGGLDSDADTPCGDQATSADELITGIHPLSEIKAGWIVCASGSGSSKANYPDAVDSGAGAGYLVGTRCGRVLSTDVGINTDICARAGDSGGPLFSQADHTALGILEGNQQDRSGACEQGELNDYSPVATILADVNAATNTANQGSQFAVITSGNG